ncbi:response regulator transcription factor [Pigmentiphaga litoralis]|uniref:Two-component system capsular synthesis response regulator RcsB n=1 Tax=Pigmentiphaga litoralis TaxID=516702 RepID=A0A7Y9IXR4_9BURK|nr:response regulator transcription factor [Pigmentiphaga litoralis]NYE21987.1 two-component system capsular synthesis response regulator RcsB [Pigmentiphaga litoralis]NYE84398.1 two-component system capsular synthesis response regulator RcsB [Pigmentiphaga litoralis]
MKPTVAIADDHPLVLQAVSGALRGAQDYTIVHECLSGQDLLDKLAQQPSEMIVMDFSMSRHDRSIDGLALLKRVRRQAAAAHIVLLTAQAHPGVLACALKESVRAIVSKEDGMDELLRACRHVQTLPSAYCSPTVRHLLDDAGATPSAKVAELTAKEMEVVRLFAAGHGLLAISDRLSRSVSTVSSQKHTAMKKLNVRSSAELIRYAYESGLI